MNKADLVERVFKQANLPSKAAAKRALEAALKAIVDEVSRGETVTLARFGTFMPRPRKAAQRINPRTKMRIQVPSKVVPGFKAGRSFKQTVARSLRVEIGTGGKPTVRRA